jgi:poly(glycerol-phosphate) alpha-glucosyltransferase
MSADVVPGDTSGLTLHLPLNTVALRRGGLVTAVLRRANLLAASGRFAGVWIEVLGLQPRLGEDVAALRDGGHLHPAVRVRSVLAALDPSAVVATDDVPAAGVVAAGALTPALGLPVLEPPILTPAATAVGEVALARADADPSEALRPQEVLADLLPDTHALQCVTDRLDPTVSLWLADGLPVARVTSTAGGGPTSGTGRPEVVELLDPAGVATRTLHLGVSGCVEHVVDRVDRADGAEGTHRFVGRDGAAYLTLHERADGTWSEPLLRAEDGTWRSLSGTGELYRTAFERLLTHEEHPVLFSEFRENLPNLADRTLDEIVAAVRHPGLRTVAVAHSNHRRSPFTADAGATPNWHRLLRGLDRWDLVVVLTEAQRADVLSEFDTARADQVVVVPHPVPPGGVRPVPDYDPDRIALVARLHPKKRVDEAVRAMRHVVDARPTARLDVYGFGYADAHEQEVHDLVASLGLREHVAFHGFVAMTGGTTPYDGACVTWLTSASEGFGMSLLESMARGVPVVSFNTPYGPADLVRDGDNGFLVPVGDTEGLAARTLQVMDDERLRRRLAVGAAVTAERADEDTFVDAWCRALGSLQGPAALRATLALPFEVESATWDGDLLRLGVGVPRDALGAELVVRVRGSGEARLLPVRHGWVDVDLPALEPGSIVDFSLRAELVDWEVRDATATEHQERRLTLPDVDLPTHPRWRLYRTQHGSFSAKARAPRVASAPTSGSNQPVSLPHRVARALSRRL